MISSILPEVCDMSPAAPGSSCSYNWKYWEPYFHKPQALISQSSRQRLSNISVDHNRLLGCFNQMAGQQPQSVCSGSDGCSSCMPNKLPGGADAASLGPHLQESQGRPMSVSRRSNRHGFFLISEQNTGYRTVKSSSSNHWEKYVNVCLKTLPLLNAVTAKGSHADFHQTRSSLNTSRKGFSPVAWNRNSAGQELRTLVSGWRLCMIVPLEYFSAPFWALGPTTCKARGFWAAAEWEPPTLKHHFPALFCWLSHLSSLLPL